MHFSVSIKLAELKKKHVARHSLFSDNEIKYKVLSTLSTPPITTFPPNNEDNGIYFYSFDVPCIHSAENLFLV